MYLQKSKAPSDHLWFGVKRFGVNAGPQLAAKFRAQTYGYPNSDSASGTTPRVE